MVTARNESISTAGEGSDAHVVLTADGTIDFVSALGRVWTQRAAFWAKVVAWVRTLAPAGDRESSAIFEGALVRVVRLEGSGVDRYLMTISAAPPLHVARVQLTPAQREVAELAAVGATIPEIARHLERSPETVRTHMREIYRRLDIASRVELVLALRPA